MDNLLSAVIETPVAIFTILLLVSLTVPPLAERLKLPGLVGLLAAGVVLGPNLLGILDKNSETIELFSDIGKIYLMFVAGLEIDLRAFRRTRNRALTFGLATFAIPLLTGTLLGHFFGLSWNASILVGSLLASHTLLAYPLLQRLGVVKNEAVTITVGATIFTDISALLVLAICVRLHAGEFSWWAVGVQIGSLLLYAAIVLQGLDWLGNRYFHRTGNDEGNQFLFILLALFLASVSAQVIHIENIVGAFLAGLAVNDVLGRSTVKEKVEFVGGVLFIPFFFIAMGLLIDLPIFYRTLFNEPGLVLGIVLGLIGSKFLAAIVTQALYRYNFWELITMWSLSLPQVAATLAAALVGFEVGLLTAELFNTIIVLMLVTSLLGPLLTQWAARHLKVAEGVQVAALTADLRTVTMPTTVVVPIANPATVNDLMNMAFNLLPATGGTVVPIAIARVTTDLRDARLNDAIAHGQLILQQATAHPMPPSMQVQTRLRVDADVAGGIVHAARELSADLILMGYGEVLNLSARLLGNVIDQVWQTSHCPVLTMLWRHPLQQIKRILIPIYDLEPTTQQMIAIAQQLVQAQAGTVTLLYMAVGGLSPPALEELRHQLGIDPTQTSTLHIKLVTHPDLPAVLQRMAAHCDLIFLNKETIYPLPGLLVEEQDSMRLRGLNCSLGLFAFPN